MRSKRGVCLAIVLGLGFLFAAARPGLAGDDATQGKKLYLKYCSACHGQTGKGDGVVSGLMRPQPTDLTQIAKKAGGTFNAQAVTKAIDGAARAHGDPDMPVWGEILGEEAGGGPGGTAAATKKIDAITGYLATIQAK
jgi:mono/diheme cytochrome c family protein